MDDFFNYMENIVTPELLIYMAAALAALIILTMLLRGMRKRRLKGMQAGLESQYNDQGDPARLQVQQGRGAVPRQ